MLFLFKEWNKKRLEKTSISLFPSENSLLNRENTGKISLHLLSMSTKDPLTINYCLCISYLSDSWWGSESFKFLVSKIDLMMWFEDKKSALKWNLLLSFCKWRWIGIRPVMASIPNMGDVQKAPEIYKTTLLCIFLSSLRVYIREVLL